MNHQRWKQSIIVASFVALLMPCAATGAEKHETLQQIINRPYITTSKSFPEAHLLYLEGSALSWSFPPQVPVTYSINTGDPLSITINAVRLPERFWRFDVAVVVEVSSGPLVAKPVVIHYQKNAEPGTTLNFRDLTVHAEPAFEPSFAPYVHVRVVAVRDYGSQDLASKLELIGKTTGRGASTLGFLHPAIPWVGIGIEAAGELMSKPDNETLLDFQFQLHPEVPLPAGRPLIPLRAATWVVAGFPKGFANSLPRLSLERIEGPMRHITEQPRSGKLGEGIQASVGRELSIPYLALTVSKRSQVVSATVLHKAAQVMDMLSAGVIADEQGLENAATALFNASMATSAFSRYKNAGDDAVSKTAALRVIGSLLATNYAAKDSKLPPILDERDEKRMLRLMQRHVPTEKGDLFLNAPSFFRGWWDNNSKGGLSEGGPNATWSTKTSVENWVAQAKAKKVSPIDALQQISIILEKRAANEPDGVPFVGNEWADFQEWIKTVSYTNVTSAAHARQWLKQAFVMDASDRVVSTTEASEQKMFVRETPELERLLEEFLQASNEGDQLTRFGTLLNRLAERSTLDLSHSTRELLRVRVAVPLKLETIEVQDERKRALEEWNKLGTQGQLAVIRRR